MTTERNGVVPCGRHRRSVLAPAWSALVAWLLGWTVLVTAPACAGTLDRAALELIFPPPFVVGEMHPQLPVWPIHRREGATLSLHAQVYESSDIEPVRGYGGKPVNLLIALSPDGRFLDVRLLAHSEPIFRSESGTAELSDFARQYEGITIRHTVQVLSPKAQRTVDDSVAAFHGVLRGTVSAMAIDRTILESAIQVASSRLAFTSEGQGAAPKAGAAKRTSRRGPDDRYARMGWNQLVDAGLVRQVAITHADLQQRFRGTPAGRLDSEGMLRPWARAIDAWFVVAGLPHAGRNLLDEDTWQRVRALRERGHQVLMVLDGGRYPVVDAAGAGNRGVTISLRQDGRPITLEPLAINPGLRMSGSRSGVSRDSQARLYQTAAGQALDPLRPFSIDLAAFRRASDVEAGEPARFTLEYWLQDGDRWRPQREEPPWLKIWQQRAVDLWVLGGALVLLTAALLMQTRLTASNRMLQVFRITWLVFTLGFIGWYAQGQLTIVNATSLIAALAAGEDAEFLLSDPMAIVLWAFVGITLFVWGRGTFCGWLCPFGALQELVSVAGRALGIRPRRLSMVWDHRLKQVKYGVLAVLLVAAAAASPAVDTMVEVEPFKTAISLTFARSWPYVLWALVCIGSTLIVYRSFCRYLCPLGAGLAVLGRVRLWRWIPRRSECGTPCQTCRHRCAYQAIEPAGRITYAECFQCLDCVAIHQDDQRCMPLVRTARGRPPKTIAITPVIVREVSR